MKHLVAASIRYVQAKNNFHDVLSDEDMLGIRGVEKRRPQLLQSTRSSAAAAQQCGADSRPVKPITDRKRIIKPTIMGWECSPTPMKAVKLPRPSHHPFHPLHFRDRSDLLALKA